MKRKAEVLEIDQIVKFIKETASEKDLLRIRAFALQKLWKTRGSPFEKCPKEIILIIFEFVNNWKLVSRICKSWRQVIKQTSFVRYIQIETRSEATMLWIIASALKRSLISRFIFTISYAGSVDMIVERGDGGMDILITARHSCDWQDGHRLENFLTDYGWQVIHQDIGETKFETSWTDFLCCIPWFSLTIDATNQCPRLYTSKLSKEWITDLKDPVWLLARSNENEDKDEIIKRLATGILEVASNKEFPRGDPAFDAQMVLLQRSFWS